MPEKRKSSRCALPTSLSRCELKLGSVVLPAMLLNKSSGGFGVLVSGLPSISARQRAQLHNDHGWFDCRIIYAKEVVPTPANYNSAELWGEEFEGLAGDDGGATHFTVVNREEFTAGSKCGGLGFGGIGLAHMEEFTARAKGPWFQLGIRCLRKIAAPSEPANSLPVEEGGFHPSQWIKTVLASIFDR